MMTAVDTSVLLDVFYEPSEHAAASAAAIRKAYDRGGLCIAPAVYAELAPRFLDQADLDASLGELGIMLVADDQDTAWQAGRCWASYRSRGGGRNRILTDFMIAAHALLHADALLTRDRGFFREHFQELVVIDPTGNDPDGDAE